MQIGLGIGIPFTRSQIWLAIQSFSPAKLFESGANGLWLDPSDLSTMVQTSDGAAPVTAVEQRVLLMLDKSKGLALGSEQLNTPYSGTVVGAFVINTDSVVRNNASGSSNASVTLSTAVVANKIYAVTFTASGVSGDLTAIRLGSVGLGSYALVEQNGTFTRYVQASASNSLLAVLPWAGTTGSVTLTNISVREIAGNHAYAPTDAARPTLSARYNLLTKTERFDDAYWSQVNGATVTADQGVAPDGTSTADKVYNPNTNSARISTVIPVAVTASTSYAASISTKAWAAGDLGKRQTIYIFDVGTSSFKGATTITLTADWQRTSIAFTTGASTTGVYFAVGTEVGTNDACTYLMWGASLTVANDGASLPYQRVNTATDYDSDPTKFPRYLKFNGSSTSMQTESIDFTSTDKMFVCAGVRKLSDVGLQFVFESSSDVTANQGAIALVGPDPWSGPAKYEFISRGSAISATATTSASYSAPITSILTGLGSIAGGLSYAKLRINSSDIVTDSANQGSVKYGTYPIYIGARAGSNYYFNGRLYQLVVCGKQVTDTELLQTEDYMELKTFNKDMGYVYNYLVDASGNPVTDASGNPIYVSATYQ